MKKTGLYSVGFMLLFFLNLHLQGAMIQKEPKNVLLIKSYHEGYTWSDSLTTGMINLLKLHPEISFFIENLNAKRFGQTHFELEKEFIQKKYEGIKFSGILVTDNDALDFVVKYRNTLFQNLPVVFTGVSNPQDYPLDSLDLYGFSETVDTDSVVDFVRKILPDSKRLLVLVDRTTTGMIYRKELIRQSERFKDLQLIIPDEVDMDTICQMVGSAKMYDAIYFSAISQDKFGNLVDIEIIADTLLRLAQVPFFVNEPTLNGKGIIGGKHQSGIKQGQKAAKLLISFMESRNFIPEKRYFETQPYFFFDQKVLDRFNIPKSRIPMGSKIVNIPHYHDSKFIIGLTGILVFLFMIVLYLYRANLRLKNAQSQINTQFKLIQNQNLELSKAKDQMSEIVSELELANSQLEEANRNLFMAMKKAEEADTLKSAFLANVSHEIRTPLNSIVGFSSLLDNEELDSETRRSYIGLIESNTESLLVLIDDIIDLSKIESQQLSLRKQVFSIDSLLDELYSVFSQSHQNQGIVLTIQKISESKELFINSDRVRINQIFVNLLSNAFKFTESGTIEFGYMEANTNDIRLFVKDSGIGIKEEYHKLIFERFRKLNSDNHKIYRGTGLGLAITQKLVQLLGGEIHVESKPGKGSIFSFTLKGLELRDSCTP